jgi:hypothetical protein
MSRQHHFQQTPLVFSRRVWTLPVMHLVPSFLTGSSFRARGRGCIMNYGREQIETERAIISQVSKIIVGLSILL